MKKPYQIESQRAVKQLGEMAADGNPSVQMVLPLAEMVGRLRKGMGELVRQGRFAVDGTVDAGRSPGVSRRAQPAAGGEAASRWGSERGYCVVMGQKVPVQRPRVRTTDDKEVRLGSYEMFHRGERLTETVWEKLMLGLSMRGNTARRYASLARPTDWKRARSASIFIEASREKLKGMMERRLDKTRLCALLIDATPFEGQQMVARVGHRGRRAKNDLGHTPRRDGECDGGW
jgi:hypothetical protein